MPSKQLPEALGIWMLIATDQQHGTGGSDHARNDDDGKLLNTPEATLKTVCIKPLTL